MKMNVKRTLGPNYMRVTVYEGCLATFEVIFAQETGELVIHASEVGDIDPYQIAGMLVFAASALVGLPESTRLDLLSDASVLLREGEVVAEGKTANDR